MTHHAHTPSSLSPARVRGLRFGILLGGFALLGAGLFAISAQADPRGPGPRGMALERFQELDADGNGQVTQAEIQSHQARLLNDHDADRDGGLSLEEYESVWLAQSRNRMVRRFQRLDADGNGTVTTAEMERMGERMLTRADRNSDGAISQDELRGPRGRGPGRGGCQDGEDGSSTL